GSDEDLIVKLHDMVERGMQAMAAGAAAAPAVAAAPAKPPATHGTLVDQTLERPLRPGEVSLDELERAFRETSTEIAPAHAAKAAAPAAKPAGAAELQEGVMKTRMQPIGNAWQKLPRIVRDLSGELGKQIELEMHGADTELDRQVLDLIKDPLTHMVRNSADHGLETPAERAAAGKPEQGTIRLSAYHEGGHIIICIADNGRGLNTEKIKAKAVANG